MFDAIKDFINPGKNPDLSSAHDYQNSHLPTLWLLGKTGAGKSSFIQALTGLSEVEVGNGFAPCTMTSSAYDFPQDTPVLRFLDTRGLGEANYDPSEDIRICADQGHALIIVAKVDEPEQSSVINALKQIRKQSEIKHLLVVHTAINSVSEADRKRMVEHNQQQFESAWGKPVKSVDVDFDCESQDFYHREELIEMLSEMLPIVGLMVEEKEYANLEEQNFDKLENEVLWYSGSASASDLVPAVGLVSVPAIQAKMLHSLANQYGVEWSKRTFSELIGTLGTSFGIQYGVKLGARQLVKLIPGYGQTVGAVAAAAVSFGTTYGLGRAACYYFYHKSKGESVSSEAMQQLYKDAFKKGKKVAGDDES
ncbi:hypothetical protein VINI7043_06665 [Vibrio nigripulchritudo ATCC 27043]|uniref:YcjF family protein n=1 Tax=Vibrio nigripulchritudo TaxID=28173 RepID=UPI00021C347A|nr:DUF697 domain-containing protein [Vibrio nigripulchritudo]EGU60288.1 hypothetical protein VINI7043_06665 [Vibrio nigripulchritudo ATCC 27043]KJY80964.1 kinase [Vibrio nigripulchritudo]